MDILAKGIFFRFVTCFLVGVFCLVLPILPRAQELFEVVNNFVLSESQEHYLGVVLNEPTTINYEIIRVNEGALGQQDIHFTYKEEPFHFINTKKVRRDHDDYSWSGLLNGGFGRCNLVVNEDRLTAFFRLDQDMFVIMPLGEGLHVLAIKTPALYPQDCPHDMEAEVERHKKEAIEEVIPREPGSQPAGKGGNIVEPNSEQENLLAGNCKLRLLVAYTDDVDASYADIQAHIQAAIDDFNDANDNSGVNDDVELARSMEVSYNESADSAAFFLEQFKNSSDGVIDNIHSDRNLFDADICVFMTQSGGGFCGLAYDIGSSYSTAFCQVAAGCAVGNHSFAHEVGHLHGCRHDTYVDPTTTPFAYGHGFTYLAANWRTIMAYNNACDCSDEVTPCPPSDERATPGTPSCTRLQNWSTPDVLNGGVAMGTAAVEKNERVLDEQLPSKSTFEPYILNKTAYEARTIISGEEFDMMGNNSLVTDPADPFVINSGAKGTFRAGTEIILREGFHARSGSEFRAYLDNCTSLAISGEEEAQLNQNELPRETVVYFHDRQVLQLKANPNPFQDVVFIIYRLLKPARVSLYLTDISGIPIRTLLLQKPTEGGGFNQLECNWGDLPAGTYFLVMKTDEQKEVQKLIKIAR